MAALALPPALDMAAAEPLRLLLLAHRGRDLELDASAVTRLGGHCLQILLAARQTWYADSHMFRITNGSEAFRDALAITQAGSLLGAEG